MAERPSGAELLAIARQVLRDRLLPRLPEDCRYDTLMVANAMAIAAREAEAGETPLRAELAGIAALYGETAADPAGRQALTQAVAAANRRLARDIRDGAFAGREAALRRHLDRVVAGQLAVSNPKALDRRRRD
jgi:hypothetical protein